MFNSSKTTFHYFLSAEAQKRHFLETGQNIPSAANVIKLDLALLTPDQRQKLLDYTEFVRNARFASYGRDFATFEVKRFANGPLLDYRPINFDTPPTVADVFAHIDRMMAEYPLAQAELERQKAEWEAEQTERAAQRKAAAELEAAQREQKRLAAAAIVWKEDGTAILDLQTAIFAASGDQHDKGGWVLEVTGIDRDNKFKMFVGEYVESGTVEISRQRRVYLVAAISGSRKYQTTTYRVVVMTDLGLLERTDISTDSATPGWQLRIRDQVAALLV